MSSYADAGVDVEAGERAVDLMRARVQATMRPEVVGDLGGFAGLFDASAFSRSGARCWPPLLTAWARRSRSPGPWTSTTPFGIDLVAMVVDDLVVCGAEPLFMTDYIATGKVVPERIAAIVSGIATGCEQAGCALLGGETAEHPGSWHPTSTTSRVLARRWEADRLLGPDRVRAGDTVIAMASSGLHSNGYSLARKVLLADWSLEREVSEFGRTLGEEMLEPTGSTPGLPRAGRRGSGARLLACHRRRVGLQPRARPAVPSACGHRTVQLGRAACLPGAARSRSRTRRRGTDPTWGSA